MQTRQRTCTPSGCDIEEATQCVNDDRCIALVLEEKEKAPERRWLAAIGAMPLNLKVLLGIAIVVIIALIVMKILRIRRKTKIQS